MYLKRKTQTKWIHRTFYKCRMIDKIEKIMKKSNKDNDFKPKMYLKPNVDSTKVYWVFYSVILIERKLREEKLKLKMYLK